MAGATKDALNARHTECQEALDAAARLAEKIKIGPPMDDIKNLSETKVSAITGDKTAKDLHAQAVKFVGPLNKHIDIDIDIDIDRYRYR